MFWVYIIVLNSWYIEKWHLYVLVEVCVLKTTEDIGNKMQGYGKDLRAIFSYREFE